MNPQPIEAQAIDKVAEDYRRRGYDVTVRPAGQLLPHFLEGHTPAIIAKGPGENVVVDFKVGTRTSVGRLWELAERVNGQPGWRFSLVYVPSADPQRPVEGDVAPLDQLIERVSQADRLLGADQFEASFLLYWSAIDGGLRFLGQRVSLPIQNLPTSAVIRELYSHGELSRADFESLDRLLPARDHLVHGLEGQVGREDVESLRKTVK